VRALYAWKARMGRTARLCRLAQLQLAHRAVLTRSPAHAVGRPGTPNLRSRLQCSHWGATPAAARRTGVQGTADIASLSTCPASSRASPTTAAYSAELTHSTHCGSPGTATACRRAVVQLSSARSRGVCLTPTGQTPCTYGCRTRVNGARVAGVSSHDEFEHRQPADPTDPQPGQHFAYGETDRASASSPTWRSTSARPAAARSPGC
jgi:hypothetical protein